MTLRKQREPSGPGAQFGTLMPPLPAFDTHWDHQLAHSYGVLGPASHTSLNVHEANATGGHGAPSTGGHSAPSTGGHGAPRTGGHGAPSTGGHGAPSTGGHGASNTGGHGASNTGGHDAPPAHITYENSWKGPKRVLQSKH